MKSWMLLLLGGGALYLFSKSQAQQKNSLLGSLSNITPAAKNILQNGVNDQNTAALIGASTGAATAINKAFQSWFSTPSTPATANNAPDLTQSVSSNDLVTNGNNDTGYIDTSYSGFDGNIFDPSGAYAVDYAS